MTTDPEVARIAREASEQCLEYLSASPNCLHTHRPQDMADIILKHFSPALTALREENERLKAELERWAKVSSERNHGASGLCCQLRDAEKRRADAAEAERDNAKEQCAVEAENCIASEAALARVEAERDRLRERVEAGSKLVNWLKQDENRQAVLQYEYESTERLAIYLVEIVDDCCMKCLRDNLRDVASSRGETLEAAIQSLPEALTPPASKEAK